jgi:Ser/Thr protein kinase RdoA (MazF antagonist)
VSHGIGPQYILRAYTVSNTQDEQYVQTLATLLTMLQGHNYPAERIMRTLIGDSLLEQQGWRYLLTTYIQGQIPPYEPQELRILGARLGQLHALGIQLHQAHAPLAPAGMQPAPELAYALAELHSVAHDVPKALSTRYETLVTAIQQIEPFDDLPHTLIHNDCHPGNSVYTPTGEMVFIDWEGAGWGPGVIDVGFLLSSCDTESPWTPPLRPDPQRVQAIIDGYCQYHMLTEVELDCLEDAMRFRALVYGACGFAAAIRAQEPEDPDDWWWRRYTAADEIADRARQCFAYYRSTQ